MDCMRILKPIEERLSIDHLEENRVINLQAEINKLKETLNNQQQQETEERFQNQRTCLVCLDDEIDLRDGVECSDKHFLCDECFSQHIITKSSNEPQQSIRARQGKVYCAGKCEGEDNVLTGGQNCPFEYTLKVICSHGNEEAIQSYTRNIARIAAWDAEEEQIRVRQQLLQQEQNQATETLLNETTKACPQCQMAIAHPRGHQCHHITCTCSHQWCYVCRGDYGKCGCLFQGSSYCGIRNGQDCGCLPCTDDCVNGQSCDTCMSKFCFTEQCPNFRQR